MLETILFFTHGALLLLFGVFLSSSFAGIRINRRNSTLLLIFCFLCGGLQISVYAFFTEQIIWKLYPLITHFPLLLFLCIIYKKRIITALAAIFTAYLCCQPAKWFGLLAITITGNETAEIITRIFSLLIVSFFTLKYLASYLSEIFNKDTLSVSIFSIIPAVYYIFDYAVSIYTDLWISNNRIVAEFLPFFLSIVYMIFCVIYYKEYERKADAKRNEQIIRITVEQQAKEIEARRRSEKEIHLLRHDMRLLLNNIALHIDGGDYKKATELISNYASHIEGTKIIRYCSNDTLNYILSDFSNKCKANQIHFIHKVEIGSLKIDETLFASILSNALENSLNAQMILPCESRNIYLMLKETQGKLLLSVENTIKDLPVFSDGIPVSPRKGHGYGTQSIRYMTEKLGGNCQFLMRNNLFILRVVI